MTDTAKTDTARTDTAASEAVEPEAPHDAHTTDLQPGEHGAHPTDAQYMKIAAILAAITALEVGVYYLKGGLGDGFAPFLVVLAAIKFFLVGAFFMHLRFDNRVLRRFFVTGIVLAIIIYTILFLLLGVFSTTHGAHG